MAAAQAVWNSLSPEQRADVRTRIAQLLGQSPTLLVLDNCEHLIEACASLSQKKLIARKAVAAFAFPAICATITSAANGAKLSTALRWTR